MRPTTETTMRGHWGWSGAVLAWALVQVFVLSDGPYRGPVAIAIAVGRVAVIVGALMWITCAVVALIRHHRARR